MCLSVSQRSHSQMNDIDHLSIRAKITFGQRDCGLRTREVRQHWGIFILFSFSPPTPSMINDQSLSVRKCGPVFICSRIHFGIKFQNTGSFWLQNVWMSKLMCLRSVIGCLWLWLMLTEVCQIIRPLHRRAFLVLVHFMFLFFAIRKVCLWQVSTWSGFSTFHQWQLLRILFMVGLHSLTPTEEGPLTVACKSSWRD